jgi:hypothetical protein
LFIIHFSSIAIYLYSNDIVSNRSKKKVENRFTAIFQKTDKWRMSFVEELPGANTQGETIDEARENLKEV